jgi:hypothetical protein
LKSSLSLRSIEAQSLRSHSLYFFIKCIHFLVVPLVLRFRRLFAAQFFERFFNGQLGNFGHIKPSLLVVGFLFAKHMIAQLDRHSNWSMSTMHQPAENTAMIIKMTGRSPPPITTALKQVSLSNSATSGDPSLHILLSDGATGFGADCDRVRKSISGGFACGCAVRPMRAVGEASREFFRRSAARSGRVIEPCGATGPLPKAPCIPRIALVPRWRIGFPLRGKNMHPLREVFQ